MPPDDTAVLVVDDDEQLCTTLRDILELHGFDSTAASSGERGLELISEDEDAFPVALVDLRLPDMHGLEVVSELHDIATLTEIVILTGHASLESAIAALRENSYDYLVKPVSPDLLVSTVERGFRRWRNRKAQEELFQDRERFQLIVEAFSDVVTVLLPDGTIQYQSPSADRVLGHGRGGLLGRPFLDLVHPSDRPSVAEVLDRARGGQQEIPPFEFRFRTADAEWRLLEGAARVLRDQQAAPVVIASRDITERRRLERELMQAQKMESIGQLAGGIAHDFNNFLTGIVGSVELAALDVEADSEAARNLRLARNTAERATSVSRQLLAFSRNDIDRPETFDLNPVVDQMGSLLRQLVGSPITLEVETAERPLWVHLDPGHLEQVVMNLVVNARDAIPERGTVVLRSRAEPAGPDAPDAAALEVADDGEGMDDEVRREIFSPFFTTKDTGTGLGLSTIRRIVEGAGGTIDVASAAGEGTTFAVRLPLVSAPEAEAPDAGEEPRPDRRALRGALILVVEDDDAVRSLVRRALERHGYTVHAVRSAAGALEFAGTTSRAPDLLLSDISLPDRTGVELAVDVLELYPDLPILFASGYEPDDWRRRDELTRRARFLAKPFDIENLLDEVEGALRSTGDAAASGA